MKDVRSFLALLLALLTISPAGLAQQAPPAQQSPIKPALESREVPDKPQVPVAPVTSFWSNYTKQFRQPVIDPVALGNSGRLENLVRAGIIYLSLDDAIALALENNLDIEMSRYGPKIAQADYLRAKAGGLLRGVPSTVTSGPTSALSQSGISGTAAGSSAGGSSVGGTVITQTGVSIPNLDPSFYFAQSFSHLSRPQANTVTSGLTAIALGSRSWNAGYQQQFLTGTTFSAAWNNSRVQNNNPFNDLNPNTSANMSVQITQKLLQGFGIAVNNRNIRVAKNNLLISDLTFKQQVMTTVAAIVNVYWDLVSYNEDFKVKQRALDVAKKFHEDNKKQVEIGTLASIEIVRAEANVASATQALVASEASVKQQETILKTALSRNGVASPTIADLRIIPTDTLRLPVVEGLPPARELIERALAQRPDLEQARINVESSKIQLGGSRSALLPSLDIQASLQNNALTGSPNTVPVPPTSTFRPSPNDYFIGGYGNVLGQIFRRNFPDYGIAFQLNIPIRNRTAQADYIRDELTLRQQQLNQQAQLNNIRQSITNAVTAVESARVGHEAAMKQRELQEKTLDAENKKYALGASSSFVVVSTQRDLAQSQASEVAALAAYARSRTQLDLLTADILAKYHVELAEARSGKVSRQSTPPAGIRN